MGIGIHTFGELKLLYQHEVLGHQRFIGQIDIGGLPFTKMAAAIELLGTVVAPAVRRALATTQPGGAPAQAQDTQRTDA